MMKQSIQVGMLPEIEQKLNALEDRVTRRMADSVESLGAIINEYADKYSRISKLVDKQHGTKKL
jgi:predicted DNA-binding protein